MLTKRPTAKMISKWKQLHEAHKEKLTPNRKSGVEVDRYFREKYEFSQLEDTEFSEDIAECILKNGYSFEKLNGQTPNVKVYCQNGIYVSIDLISGEFFVECDKIEQAIPIYDDLFVFRGLDKYDINNCFLAAQYIELTALTD